MTQAALISTESERFNGLTIGKVSKVYPEANMVDIVMYDGSILKQVQVMTPNASSRGGVAGLPVSSYEADMLDRNKRPLPLNNAKVTESDVFAVLGFIGGSIIAPFVLGFLFPENCEILCGRDQKGNEDGTQFIWKHDSNVYVRVAKGYPAGEGEDRDGSGGTSITPDIEISHPSGCLIKIGNVDYGAGFSGQRTEITNWDKDIRPFKHLNPQTGIADPAPSVLITHPSGTYIVIMPSGETWIDTTGNLGIEVHGDMSEEVDGNVTRTYHGNVTETIEGNESKTVNGDGTDYIKGTWLRKSDTEIEDKCGTIHHNK